MQVIPQEHVGSSELVDHAKLASFTPEFRKPATYESFVIFFLGVHHRVSVRSDSLADDAVWSEPLSSGKFPVRQGKYREFRQFERLAGRQLGQKPRVYKDLEPNSLLEQNREFRLADQGI